MLRKRICEAEGINSASYVYISDLLPISVTTSLYIRPIILFSKSIIKKRCKAFVFVKNYKSFKKSKKRLKISEKSGNIVKVNF